MEKNPTMLFVVAAALTNQAGEILLQKRPLGKQMAGFWEFPGGKVETGESPEDALVRELQEELGVLVEATDLRPGPFATYRLDRGHLLILLYKCNRWQGEPRPLESPELRWVAPAEMHHLAMPPADLPLVDALDRGVSASISEETTR